MKLRCDRSHLCDGFTFDFGHWNIGSDINTYRSDGILRKKCTQYELNSPMK